MKLKDATVGILIIGVILMFITPLPSPVLDVLLAVNITTSVIILLNTIYSKGPLDMSIFPSLLLIMTMFRLGLNLSTTKLILGDGQGTDKAGQVIESFGQFVAGGNMVVGFIIFIIGIHFCLLIEKDAGFYECKHCGCKHIPTYKQVLWSMHSGRTRFIKCPKCNKKSWQKKH